MRKTEASLDAKEFAHRCNPDNTFDSICLTCFHTIANAKTEAELLPYEAKHRCDEYTPTPQNGRRKH